MRGWTFTTTNMMNYTHPEVARIRTVHDISKKNTRMGIILNMPYSFSSRMSILTG
jgi:hypothetical protein